MRPVASMEMRARVVASFEVSSSRESMVRYVLVAPGPAGSEL